MATKNTHGMNLKQKKEPFDWRKLTDKQKLCYKIVFGAIALVIVAAIVLAEYDLLPHFDGSLHYVNGKLLGVSETDIISNLGGSQQSEKKYYKIGEYEIPEGFTVREVDDASRTKTDSNETEVVFNAPEQYKKIESVRILSTNTSSAERLESLRTMTGTTNEETGETVYGEIISRESPVRKNSYNGYMYGGTERDSYNNYYERYFFAYVDGEVENTSVMLAIIAKAYNQYDIPADETMMELMDKLADAVIVKN